MRTEDGPAHVRGWIEVSESGAALVLRIGGELDAASRISIEPEVMAATVSAGSVVIDLEALTFCDSSGIAMFIAAQTNAKSAVNGARNPQPSPTGPAGVRDRRHRQPDRAGRVTG